MTDQDRIRQAASLARDANAAAARSLAHTEAEKVAGEKSRRHADTMQDTLADARKLEEQADRLREEAEYLERAISMAELKAKESRERAGSETMEAVADAAQAFHVLTGEINRLNRENAIPSIIQDEEASQAAVLEICHAARALAAIATAAAAAHHAAWGERPKMG